MVERACDALLEALRPHIAAKYPDAVDMDKTWADATEEARAIFIPAMHAALEAGCAGLVAENERLREALKPFAAFADLAGAGLLPADHVITLGSGMAARQLTIGDCRNARTALRGDREQGEG
jgi:hypothetical protein